MKVKENIDYHEKGVTSNSFKENEMTNTKIRLCYIIMIGKKYYCGDKNVTKAVKQIISESHNQTIEEVKKIANRFYDEDIGLTIKEFIKELDKLKEARNK